MNADSLRKILIVHPLPICRVGLRHVIGMHSEMSVCAEVATLELARRCRDSRAPQIVIVDPEMEDEEGFDFIQETCRVDKSMRCIAYSDRLGHSSVEQAFRLGALAVLSHLDEESAILDALSAVTRGVRHMSPCVSEDYCKGLIVGTATEPDEKRLLTHREMEIYQLIGRGLPIKEVATLAGISPRTVESHELNIKSKLRLKCNGELRRRAILFVGKIDTDISDQRR